MSKQWPMVRLGELLRLDLDRVPIDPSSSYPMIGVLSFGRGLFERESIENGNTSYRHFSRLKAEHIVMSQLFGWEGALALSSEKFAGKFVSPQFPTFLCETARIDRSFLGWALRRPILWADLSSRASGMGDRRRTLNPDALYACEIPLPPLAEQKQIVSRIEKLAEQITTAQLLRQQADEESQKLLVCMAHRRDLTDPEKQSAGWRRISLGQCIKILDDIHRVSVDKSYPNLGIYSFGKGLFHKPPIEGIATSASSLRRVREGQFIYSRLFAFEGSYGMVTKEYDGCFVSNEYPTFECDPKLVRIEFLNAYFKAPSIWKEVAVGSKGLGDRRQRVQPEQVLSHVAWIPPLEWQNRLAEVQFELDRLKRLQAETVVELDALLPSILDRAFKGKLM